MEIVFAVVLFGIGLFLVVKGGDLFVDAATWIAKVSGVPQFIIGATLVSVATTLPEQLVSCFAAVQGKTEMAIGNAVGSVTANTGMILALSIVFLPSVIRRRQLAAKSLLLLLSCLTLWLLCRDGSLTLGESFLLLLLFVGYLVENLRSAARENRIRPTGRQRIRRRELAGNVLRFLLGTAALVVGSDLLVDNGTVLAQTMRVPERLISVTMIAIGTSLPELVTAITAIVKRQPSLSVGNILGANIIDLTIILPLCALLSRGTLPVSAATVALDLPVCLLVTATALVPALIFRRFSRVQGVGMLAIYASYLVNLVLF